ncbi:MAG: hypothetical protein NT045_02195 [Candidatus Aureabacteria bacterium]|nr:hypothetical protein [Candidatus Auribacterota bacterium]
MKKVLFLCRRNSCRSQVAEAFARRFGADCLDTRSAGIDPAPAVDPMAMAVLKERGFDPAGLAAKGLGSVRGMSFDVCVHFGDDINAIMGAVSCADTVDWGDIPDPEGRAYAEYRKAREDIGGRVMGLITRTRGKG